MVASDDSALGFCWRCLSNCKSECAGHCTESQTCHHKQPEAVCLVAHWPPLQITDEMPKSRYSQYMHIYILYIYNYTYVYIYIPSICICILICYQFPHVFNGHKLGHIPLSPILRRTHILRTVTELFGQGTFLSPSLMTNEVPSRIFCC